MKNIITRIICTLLVLAAVASSDIAFAAEVWNKKAQENFELPVEGSTGYGIIDLNMRSGDGTGFAQIATVPAGEPFCILAEGSSYFQVRTEAGTEGWVSKTYSMINLPDVIPSIRYNCTNAYSSLFRSCGEAMDLTGTALYTGATENAKLGYAEFNMPVLYNMAKKIAYAQSKALSEGYTLVLYEGYRPLFVQQKVTHDLEELMSVNKTVRNAIKNGGWAQGWFIASSVSNHQMGYAIDVSLASITEAAELVIDGRTLKVPTVYEEVQMPTAMHELSPASASLTCGVNSSSKTAWQSVGTAKTMTDGAKLLRSYCVEAGMTPLASEWWHFNDIDAKNATKSAGSGLFSITKNVSLEIR